MRVDKSLMSGSTTMLILKLLDLKDMYGYQMIQELALRSENVFSLKAGTLYPILHSLEQQGMIESYEQVSDQQRPRKYYRITLKGKEAFKEQQAQWKEYTAIVNRVLGGANYALD
ncbi:PadR family transcriptional regulator [Paenibacillus aceti]|uniref:PadR family transcriptional regulator n=1 Tax=Paenibacillus aceti TaxID=1820010 RepID=A0ABQ1VQ41_9BACL|nr:PadR family transcriptional regulator [Paenibacillus aceti]GGF85708.1 PadR family transcriptional regulator [Paenibacillus aceti]